MHSVKRLLAIGISGLAAVGSVEWVFAGNNLDRKAAGSSRIRQGAIGVAIAFAFGLVAALVIGLVTSVFHL